MEVRKLLHRDYVSISTLARSWFIAVNTRIKHAKIEGKNTT